MGHADFDEFAAEFAEKRDACVDFLADAGVHALGEIFFGDADARTFERFCQFGEVVGNESGGGSGVVGIAAGDGLQDGGGVSHFGGEGADAVE